MKIHLCAEGKAKGSSEAPHVFLQAASVCILPLLQPLGCEQFLFPPAPGASLLTETALK